MRKLPTGEPCAGEPPARFGGRGGREPFPTPINVYYVQQQIQELQADDLDYQYEEALTLLGQVVAEQHRFDRFEALARQMGARHWKRIVVLADRAVQQRKRQLAIAVFEAALSPGMHEGFLRKKYEQLKKGKWSPDPRR